MFQVRYLSGNTSGTGGTVIGTYRTSVNGSFTVTGCKAGTYIIEELSSDGSHVIDTPPQTVYLSGKDQEVVQVYFNNSPKGSLLIKKVSSADNSPISDVQFFVTESDGTVVGDSNGYFATDSAGTILIEGIDLAPHSWSKKPGRKMVSSWMTHPRRPKSKPGKRLPSNFAINPQDNSLSTNSLAMTRKRRLKGYNSKSHTLTEVLWMPTAGSSPAMACTGPTRKVRLFFPASQAQWW